MTVGICHRREKYPHIQPRAHSHSPKVEIAMPCTPEKSNSKRSLLRLEEEDGAVTEVEVDEVLCLVGDERAKVTADDTVPGRALALIELENG